MAKKRTENSAKILKIISITCSCLVAIIAIGGLIKTVIDIINGQSMLSAGMVMPVFLVVATHTMMDLLVTADFIDGRVYSNLVSIVRGSLLLYCIAMRSTLNYLPLELTILILGEIASVCNVIEAVSSTTVVNRTEGNSSQIRLYHGS